MMARLRAWMARRRRAEGDPSLVMRTYVRNEAGRSRAKSAGRVPIVRARALWERRHMLLGLALGVIVAGAAPGPTVAVQDAGHKLAVTRAAPGARSATETAPPPL